MNVGDDVIFMPCCMRLQGKIVDKVDNSYRIKILNMDHYRWAREDQLELKQGRKAKVHGQEERKVQA
jgi:hypothetical protein